MSDYIILLPPSEGKSKAGDETKPYRMVKNLRKYNSFINLEIEREFIYNSLRDSLQKLSESELEKVFELKGSNLQEAIEVLSDLLNKETMPAIQRYSGVMFNAIEYSSLEEKRKENFDSSVIFVDGMFGLLRPQDYIPEYKLKINSKFLKIDVSKYWKEHLKSDFQELFRNKTVIDLLPEAHRKVVEYKGAKEVFKIGFAEKKNNKIVATGHNSKKLKGGLIRHIVARERVDEDYLKTFKHSEGYIFSEKHSNLDTEEKELIFLKK